MRNAIKTTYFQTYRYWSTL